MLDQIAHITAGRGPTVEELRDLYQGDPRLPLPASVTSYDPLGGPPRDVGLEGLVPDAA